MRRIDRAAFALLLLLTGAWLMYETRGTTLLTALDITQPVADPDHVATGIAGHPLVVVRAGDHNAMKRPDLAPASWHARVETEDKVAGCGAPS